MSSELTAATLTVTITEALAVVHATSADNLDFAQTTTHTFSSVGQVDKRIIKLSTTALTTVATFDNSDPSGGTFKRGDIKYIRVTNLDGSASLQVGLDDSDTDAAYSTVAADASIIYTSATVEGNSGGTTLDNALTLRVKGAVNQPLEVLIASA
jgi:hypothetical protein